MLDRRARRRQPLALDPARHADSRLAHLPAAPRLHVDRHEELAAPHAALIRKDGAMARREQHARRARCAATRHAIRIAREHGPAEGGFANVRMLRTAEHARGDALNFLRDAPDVPGERAPVIDR